MRRACSKTMPVQRMCTKWVQVAVLVGKNVYNLVFIHSVVLTIFDSCSLSTHTTHKFIHMLAYSFNRYAGLFIPIIHSTYKNNNLYINRGSM